MERIRSVITRQTLILLGILFIALAILATTYLALQRQEIRKRAQVTGTFDLTVTPPNFLVPKDVIYNASASAVATDRPLEHLEIWTAQWDGTNETTSPTQFLQNFSCSEPPNDVTSCSSGDQTDHYDESHIGQWIIFMKAFYTDAGGAVQPLCTADPAQVAIGLDDCGDSARQVVNAVGSCTECQFTDTSGACFLGNCTNTTDCGFNNHCAFIDGCSIAGALCPTPTSTPTEAPSPTAGGPSLTPAPSSTPGPSTTPTRTPTPGPSATPTPTGAPTATPTITPTPPGTNLSLSLNLEGFLGTAVPARKTEPVTIKLKAASDGSVFEPPAGTLTYSTTSRHFEGTIPLGTTIQTGDYQLLVKPTSYLTRNFGTIHLVQNTPFSLPFDPTKPLFSCDIAPDNSIDMLDIQQVYTDIKKGKIESFADITRDGFVDIFDHNYCVENFGKQGETWQ